MRERDLCRRRWVTVAIVASVLGGTGGCGGSSGKRSEAGGSRPKSAGKRKPPKGPQTMGNLLLDSYIADLGGSSVDAQIRAARELGNMGAGAKSALPALEKLATGGKPKAAAAAKQAVTAIRKR